MSLATITQLVDDKLRSTSLGDLAPTDVRDRAIVQALLQYGADAPQQLSADVAVPGGEAFGVPPAWDAARSQLVAVEYPVGQAPMATLPAVVTRTTSDALLIVLLQDTLPAATVRVHFTGPHAGDGSTIPAEHDNAIACWAAAELCRQVATKLGHDRDATISAGAVDQQSQSGELARRARDWLLQYRTTLGLPDPDKASGGQAAGTVVRWEGDGHRRARFSALGY